MKKINYIFTFIFLFLFHILTLSAKDYILDTDIGFDVDDSYALIYLLNSHVDLKGVTTSGIYPNEKADIARTLISLYQQNIPVFPGVGFYHKQTLKEFFKIYPFWPIKTYGSPYPKHGQKLIYTQQGEAFKTLPGWLKRLQRCPTRAIRFIIEEAERHSPQNKLNIISIAPLNNIATALKAAPHIVENIKLWVMGGWYQSEEGTKISYNTKMNPQDFNTILKLNVETIILPTNVALRYAPRLNCIHKRLKEKNFLALALSQDLHNWQHEAHTDKISIYDLLTAFLAVNPDSILNTIPLEETLPYLEGTPYYGIITKDLSASNLRNVRVIQKVQEDEIPANVCPHFSFPSSLNF